MKLKKNFVTQDLDDSQFLIPLVAEAFHGILRSNPTAAFIIECLKKETTFEGIVDAVYDEFDADRETIEKDVKTVLDTLRSIDAIEDFDQI